jgi:hypothetical protein
VGRNRARRQDPARHPVEDADRGVSKAAGQHGGV